MYDLVPNKVKFPIQNLDPELEKYLDETQSVDYSHQAIRNKANELVAGEDDLYIAVNTIGIWIQENIEYNLSTVTADASQTASWVMEKRYGVCDEITKSLFSYDKICRNFLQDLFLDLHTLTPLYLMKNGGLTGWAEVYFPGYGWIPFDITYNQFGWLDPSHIKLKESLDCKRSFN